MHGRKRLDFGARCRAGLAARVLAAVLCGVASAGPAAAQTIYANLETAVTAFTEALVHRSDRLRGQRVIVGPRYFHDELGKRLPLSEFLSRQFQAKLLSYDVTPVEPGGSEDEDRMMVLHGRWRLLDDGIHLTAHVREPIVDGSGTVASAPPARVRDFDRRLLALDLGFLGRDMVRQLESGVRDGRRRTIHAGEFTVEGEGVGDPERLRRYLMARWLRPAFRDSLFTLRSGGSGSGEGDGMLSVYAYATPEHLEVSMHVEGAGERVPSATIDVPVELVSIIGGPDVGAILARCEEQAETGRLRDAWGCYGDVPETPAGSAGARAGRARIVDRYAERVREALEAEDFETAERIVGELSGLTPTPGGARGLEAEVARAREAANHRAQVELAVESAKEALGRGALGEAKGHVERLRALDSRHLQVAELEGEIVEAKRRAEERRAAAEAEARRKAEEERRRAEERRIAELAPEVVSIEGGCFRMGSPESETERNDDERRHEVCVGGFSIGKHEVTRREYARFAGETGRAVGHGCWTYESGEWEERSGWSWRTPGYGQEATHPVVCVSHEDAEAYARWLSEETGRAYRLPTEAEWEYAARAGTETSRHWGDDPSGACEYANVGDRTVKEEYSDWTIHACPDGHVHTALVGSFEANGYGLHDILGNVWEWTCSEYDEGYGGAEQRCASGSAGRLVLRGGGWGSDPGGVRSAARGWSDAGFRLNILGFRLVQD